MTLSKDRYVPPHVFSKADRGDGRAITVDEIDLEALAEEVYALLKRELQLELERQGRNRSR